MQNDDIICNCSMVLFEDAKKVLKENPNLTLEEFRNLLNIGNSCKSCLTDSFAVDLFYVKAYEGMK